MHFDAGLGAAYVESGDGEGVVQREGAGVGQFGDFRRQLHRDAAVGQDNRREAEADAERFEFNSDTALIVLSDRHGELAAGQELGRFTGHGGQVGFRQGTSQTGAFERRQTACVVGAGDGAEGRRHSIADRVANAGGIGRRRAGRWAGARGAGDIGDGVGGRAVGIVGLDIVDCLGIAQRRVGAGRCRGVVGAGGRVCIGVGLGIVLAVAGALAAVILAIGAIGIAAAERIGVRAHIVGDVGRQAELFDGRAVDLDDADLERHLILAGDAHQVDDVFGLVDIGLGQVKDLVGLAVILRHAAQDDVAVQALRIDVALGEEAVDRVAQLVGRRVDADIEIEDLAAHAVKEDGIRLTARDTQYKDATWRAQHGVGDGGVGDEDVRSVDREVDDRRPALGQVEHLRLHRCALRRDRHAAGRQMADGRPIRHRLGCRAEARNQGRGGAQGEQRLEGFVCHGAHRDTRTSED